MKKIYYSLMILPLLAACTAAEQAGEGAFSLSVSVEAPATKAAMTSDELLSTAVVKIYKADFSGKVREYVYSEMPSQIYLPADEYRVDVTAGEAVKASPAAASWEQKSYSGSESFTVTAGAASTAKVTAKVSNVISNVTFADDLGDFFAEGYNCTVALDDASKLVYTADKSGADGYFIASGYEPSLTWTFSGTLLKDNSAFTKTGTISAVEGGKRYKLGLKYVEKDGTLGFDLLVDDSTNNIYDNIIFVASSTGISSSTKFEVWAGHFTAHADVDEAQYDKDKVYFEVRAKGSETWTMVPATRESEGAYSAEIKGLSPETEYEYRLAVTSLESGEEEYMDAPSTITTEAAPAIPNGSFETTSNDEGSKYKSFYDPSSSDTALQTKWWDNGNSGSTMVGSSSVICYPVTDDYKDGSQSVCLQSRYVVVKFAAGNLFCGHFGELIGTSGGTVFFGRPFTGRPTALRFWMKYSGGIINRASDNVPEAGKKGNYDKASIRIALGTWDYRTYDGDADSPVCVNTTDTDTFVDYTTDASTIAYAEKIVSSDSTNPATDWIEVTLPLEYRDTNKRPTHIIISCASSMYGDYFSGYDESKLWLDGMKLLYE
jgi:hypothetical protein